MSTKRFTDKLCVLCLTRKSSRAGEHVWPKWLVTDNELFGPGPYTLHIDGEPTRKRSAADGELGPVRTQSSLMGTRVPMCVDCNGVLNRRLEVPVKELVRQLLPRSSEHVWPSLSAASSRVLALWALKIGLLLKHPQARHDDPDQDAQAHRLRQISGPLLTWMVNGGEPPDGLSLFLTRPDESLPEPERRLIPTPTVRVGGVQTEFFATSFGPRGIDFEMVFHPGWPLCHPLVEDGTAARIWPDPGPVDLKAIGPVHPRSIGYLAGSHVTLRPEASSSPHLPPLSCDLDLLGLVSSGLAISAGR